MLPLYFGCSFCASTKWSLNMRFIICPHSFWSETRLKNSQFESFIYVWKTSLGYVRLFSALVRLRTYLPALSSLSSSSDDVSPSSLESSSPELLLSSSLELSGFSLSVLRNCLSSTESAEASLVLLKLLFEMNYS